MKKILLYISILIVLIGLFSPVVKLSAQTNTGYQLLAPLPKIDKTFNPGDDKALGKYLNIMIGLTIGISAVLAVVMIVIGGMEYMTSELVSSKEEGRKRMTNAVLGLLIALGAYALLFTINPDLLNTNIKIPVATVTVTATTNSAVPKPSSASARCVVAPTGNSCAPGNLSAFGSQANNASRICMVESNGNASSASDSDKCGSDIFSYGLFQINVLANGNLVKDSSGNPCTGLFETTNGVALPGTRYIIPKPDGTFDRYDCKLKSGQGARLASCAATLKNPAENIRIAASLNQSRPNFADWRLSDQGVCPVAFQ